MTEMDFSPPQAAGIHPQRLGAFLGFSRLVLRVASHSGHEIMHNLCRQGAMLALRNTANVLIQALWQNHNATNLLHSIPFHGIYKVCYNYTHTACIWGSSVHHLYLSQVRLFETVSRRLGEVVSPVKLATPNERTNRNTLGFEADAKVSPSIVPGAGQALWELT